MVLAALASVMAHADDWKDESGKRRGRGAITVPVPLGPVVPGAYYGPPPIPSGHLPPPGECRTWFPDRPAGQQPPPYRC